ncbi:MAG TPA: hypothetical protein VEI46_06650, partial [Thermodesulfovibrionales bacterium]|nr:hypothetical protein [Thermodesulfovibrionales bacterium]
MKRIVFPEEKSVKGAVSYGKKAVGAFLITGMVLTCVCLKDRATAEGLQEGQVSQPVVQKPDGGGGKESKVIALVNGMAITEADIERDMAVISAAR